MGIFNFGSKKASEFKVEGSQESILQNDNQIIVQEEPAQNNQMVSKNSDGRPINKDMTIGEVVRLYPDTVPVMLENGIHCVGCHVAHWETLEQGFRGHYGMNDEKLKDFIEQLNQVVDNNIKTEMPK